MEFHITNESIIYLFCQSHIADAWSGLKLWNSFRKALHEEQFFVKVSKRKQIIFIFFSFNNLSNTHLQRKNKCIRYLTTANIAWWNQRNRKIKFRKKILKALFYMPLLSMMNHRWRAVHFGSARVLYIRWFMWSKIQL
jgi:hypothetical protein